MARVARMSIRAPSASLARSAILSLGTTTLVPGTSAMGRFMSPDWSVDPAAIPYGDVARPQSLNLYSYTLNNPASYIDPMGHSCSDDNATFLSSVTTTGSNGATTHDSVTVSGNCNPPTFAPTALLLVPRDAPTKPTPQAPSKTSRLACAAKFGQSHSVGAAFGGGAIANFFGGNSVSSLLTLVWLLQVNKPFRVLPILLGLGWAFQSMTFCV
jgi:hypothetical protein